MCIWSCIECGPKSPVKYAKNPSSRPHTCFYITKSNLEKFLIEAAELPEQQRIF